jgi:Copper amine oxidase, enzyme domain
MLRISALALVLSMMGPSLATGACPAFTHLDNTLLTPPPEVTPSGNPLHYREWVYQEFPAYGLQHVNSVSAWAVHLIQHSVNATHANQVLAIDRAIYITTEGKRIEVLRGLWPQQIIVPYAQSSDVVYDLLSNPPLLSLTDNEAALAPCGELGPAIYPRNWAAARNDLAPPGSPRSIYVKEIGDVGMENASYNGYGRGIAERPPEMRRGSELVLWAVSDSDNYDNIIAYHFRDDGEVTALLGPTGWNTTVGPPARVKSGNTPHAHTVLWLMRPAVADRHGGQDIGIVEYNQHVDQDGKTTEHYSVEPVTTERRVVFDAAKFTRLRISDPESFNDPAPGKPAQENEYVMTLISDGTPRHRLTASDDDSAPRFDFAIVVDRVSEHTAEPFPSKRYDSLDDLLDNESIVGKHVAIYAFTTIAHIPRSEDFVVHPGAPDYQTGAPANRTTVKWSGIRLTPRNVYTRVPFSQPTPGVETTGHSPLPLTRACAPLAIAPTVEEQGCANGVTQYRLGLSPINQNPFGKPATSVEISGPEIVGSPVRISTELQYGAAQSITPDQGSVVVSPAIGEQQVCLSVAMAGDDWRCPSETQCIKVAGAACSN